jgi:hypothetical protein
MYVRKIYLRTDHRSPEREDGYSSTLSLSSTLNGGGCLTQRPGCYIPLRNRNQVPILQEAWWAPWPVWTDAENLAPTGIRSPDRSGRSESLYWLRYPGPCMCVLSYIFMHCYLCWLWIVPYLEFMWNCPFREFFIIVHHGLCQLNAHYKININIKWASPKCFNTYVPSSGRI